MDSTFNCANPNYWGQSRNVKKLKVQETQKVHHYQNVVEIETDLRDAGCPKKNVVIAYCSTVVLHFFGTPMQEPFTNCVLEIYSKVRLDYPLMNGPLTL